MKYGAVTRAILEHLAESGKGMIDAFLPPQYPEAALARMLLGIDQNRSRQAGKHLLSSMLHQLKKQGLVASTGPNKKTVWRITKGGRKFLRQPKHYAIDVRHTLPPEDGTIRLVTFDIPEKERGKRRWLRAELLSLGFSSLHKSVFIGRRPLADDFLKAVDEFQLGKYVHIVGIEHQGTLNRKRR